MEKSQIQARLFFGILFFIMVILAGLFYDLGYEGLSTSSAIIAALLLVGLVGEDAQEKESEEQTKD